MKKSILTYPLSTTQKLSLSFIGLIFIGSLLLASPIMHYPNAPETSYLDHLFTAVSMVCVTGLSVFPISEVYNGLGQVTAMALMQIGGLGLVSLVAFSQYSLKKRLSLRDQTLLQSAMSQSTHHHLKEYLFFAYRLTFGIELICAILLAFDFIPRFGWGNGIFNSLFLAVSAFCNAGFDNIGQNSLQVFALNPLINLVLAFLIFSGGLGFNVWQDLYNSYLNSRQQPRFWANFWKHLSIHSRLILNSTAIILLLGTGLSFLLEYNNSETLKYLTFPEQILVSFFQSVTMRTAGFSTLSYLDTGHATNFLYILQMLIGGGPGGTAGGIKVSVAAILFLLFRAELAGQSQVTFQNRTIPQRLLRQTLTVLLFFFGILIIGYLLLLENEPHLDPFALFFEASSAIATVGVSMELTSQLSTIGRCIIMALMFIGRVGPITVLLSILQKKEKDIHYAECDIIIG